jgi:hypothetical protein
LWHKSPYFIDHGAALYFHHDWRDIESAAVSRFTPIRNHILLRSADNIEAADQTSRSLLNEEIVAAIINSVPEAWLLPVPGLETPEQKRWGYLNYFLRRLENASQFVTEAVRAHAELI